jgi:hypothetical protein
MAFTAALVTSCISAIGAVAIFKDVLNPVLKAPFGVTLPEAMMLRGAVQLLLKRSNVNSIAKNRIRRFKVLNEFGHKNRKSRSLVQIIKSREIEAFTCRTSA